MTKRRPPTSPIDSDIPDDITVTELVLAPITTPLPPAPVYPGPVAEVLQYDRFCDCEVMYENQILVPKRHSVICFCPRCGCVTVD